MKAVVQFRGREIAHVDLGKKLLIRFSQDLALHGTVEGQPRLEGRNAHVIISPIKKDKVEKKEPKEVRSPGSPQGPASAPPSTGDAR